MRTHTIECVGMDCEMTLQIVEFAETKSVAHELASQTANNAGMKTPQSEMASQQVEVDGKSTPMVQAFEQHEKASLTSQQMDYPTIDLSLGLSLAIAPAKDIQIYTPIVQSAAQDWESPRVLLIEFFLPPLETSANKAPVTTTDDVVLYSYIVRLKNREKMKKRTKFIGLRNQRRQRAEKRRRRTRIDLSV